MGEKIQKLFEIIRRGILEIIYPREENCIICKKEEAQGLCKKCMDGIVKSKDNENYIGYYKGPLKELILKLKYKKDFEAGDILVDLLEDKLKNFDNKYYFTYIPIGKESLKIRHFNQCEYIAKELAFRKNTKAVNTLKRVKETKTQKTLRKEERYKNLKGAFEAIDKGLIEGKSFILIDDVCTTGATISEGMSVLTKNGSLEVKVLFVAKSNI